MLWKIVPAMRPRVEFARRFTGQLAWSSLDLNKTDVLHSVSFSTSHYVDMVGFEMLTSSASYRIRYTVTQGTGVLGKLVARGRAFVSSSNILSPTKLVKFGKLRRLYPHTLYSIHVLIDIDEFSTSLVTTGGTAGVSLVETGSGVVVHYGNALESCEKTTVHMGQISGIAFWRIDHREEQYLESLTLPAYAGYRETGTMTNPSQDLCFVNTAEDRENLPPMQRGTGVSYCASRILAPCDQIPDPWMNSCTSTSKRVSFVQALPSADLSMSQLPLQGRSSRLNELNSRTTILLKQTAPELSVHTDKLLPIGISQVLDCENQLPNLPIRFLFPQLAGLRVVSLAGLEAG